jgi:hypothetical protein
LEAARSSSTIASLRGGLESAVLSFDDHDRASVMNRSKSHIGFAGLPA